MRGSEMRVYADAFDMAALFTSFNRDCPLRYTETLCEPDQKPIAFDDAMQLMGFAQTTHPHWVKVFMGTEAGGAVGTRVVRINDGCVFIRLGGMVGRILIATSINTTADTEAAKRIFKRLKKLVTEVSRYGDGAYVMGGALAKLRSGWRLTHEVECSPGLDVRVSAFNDPPTLHPA